YGFDSPPYLTPTSSPTTSVIVNWNTEKTEPGVIAFGITPSLEDTISINEKTYYHHIILNNLVPGTLYYYKVLPHGQIHQFKTFPISSDSFSFIIIGDTRSDPVSHQAVVDRMQDYNFEFIVHTGDFVASGYNPDDWKTFFAIESQLLSEKMFLPTIGNHEKPFWQYDSLFVLPGVEDYYSVRYANLCIISLNTETELEGLQKKWLINELNFLSTDTSIDWIFVSLHRPPYSSGSHGSNLKVRDTWCPVFEKYGVDIVFCGHDHSYERTKEINGVIYIVCAGGGAPLYDVGKNDWTEYSEKTHHFCFVTVTKRNIDLKAIKPDGTVFDSLILKK
ncbi:MAG: metallophosphoesterase family protein, partial [candidate division WOR-3 bacterium]